MKKRLTARIFWTALVAAEAEGYAGVEPAEGEAKDIRLSKMTAERRVTTQAKGQRGVRR
jgi:hypothetical protein